MLLMKMVHFMLQVSAMFRSSPSIIREPPSTRGDCLSEAVDSKGLWIDLVQALAGRDVLADESLAELCDSQMGLE